MIRLLAVYRRRDDRGNVHIKPEKFWLNFYHMCRKSRQLENGYIPIYQILLEWRGKMVSEENNDYIEFEDERDATAFLLRWS
jgi:hypothetical protein